MIKIALPLPSPKLSTNARLHWAVKSKIVKSHRLTARAVCSLIGVGFNPVRLTSYTLHFYWPDKRRRDRDNAVSRCKAYLDGVADAVRQDDSAWEFNGVRFYVDKARPRLEIWFEEAPKQETGEMKK